MHLSDPLQVVRRLYHQSPLSRAILTIDWAEAFARAWWSSLEKCWQPPSTTMTAGWFELVGGFNPSEKYEFVSWDDS